MARADVGVRALLSGATGDMGHPGASGNLPASNAPIQRCKPRLAQFLWRTNTAPKPWTIAYSFQAAGAPLARMRTRNVSSTTVSSLVPWMLCSGRSSIAAPRHGHEGHGVQRLGGYRGGLHRLPGGPGLFATTGRFSPRGSISARGEVHNGSVMPSSCIAVEGGPPSERSVL